MASMAVDISNNQCLPDSFLGIMKYFDTLLLEHDNDFTKLMAALLVLEGLFESDPKRVEYIRKTAVDSGFIKSLFKLLKPYPLFEKGFITPFLTCSPLLYSVILRSINSVISQKGINLAACLDLPSLKVLMSFLIPNPGEFNFQPHHFYQYNIVVTAMLKELLLDNHPKVLVKLHSQLNQSDFIEELSFYEPVYSRVSLDNKMQVCSIRVSTGKCVNVADHLIDQKLVWKAVPKQISKGTENNGNPDEIWTESRVTNVVNGAYFWILYGNDIMKLADDITETLKSQRDILEKIKALEFDAVVVEAPAHSGGELVRATVMREKEGVYTVYAVDSGHVYEVDCVFGLPRELSLSTIPSLALLCRLDGILPTPLNSRAVELALASLNVLCRYMPKATDQLLEMGILSTLPNLIGCPNYEIVNQALNLSANLLFRKKIPFCDKWKKIMLSCLDVLEQCVQRNIALSYALPSSQTSGDCEGVQGQELTIKGDGSANSDEENEATQKKNVPLEGHGTVSKTVNKKIVNNCLLLLSNRLFICPEAKNFFCFNKGILSVIRINLLYPKNHIIHKSSVQVLCNYVRSASERFYPLFKSPRGGAQENRQENQVIQTSKGQEPTKANKFVPSQGSVSHNENGHIYGICQEPDSGDSSDRNDHDKLTRRNVTSVLFNQAEDNRVRFMLGEKLPFVADITHEFHHTYNLSPDVFSRIVCGMLNTGLGGKFYFGVDETGVVTGEKLTKTIRDEIRLGLDQIMSNVVPPIFHMQYGVRFVPVVEPQLEMGNEQATESEELFVVVMSFKPAHRVIYCCNGGESFYRRGARNLELLQQDVWEMCVLEEEAWYLDEIDALKAELAALHEEDAMLKEELTASK